VLKFDCLWKKKNYRLKECALKKVLIIHYPMKKLDPKPVMKKIWWWIHAWFYKLD